MHQMSIETYGLDVVKAKRIRKAPKPVTRGVSVLLPMDGSNGVIEIRVGKVLDTYHVCRVPSDFGAAFRVEKFGGNSYDVCLYAPEGHLCDCIAHQHRGICRHVQSLVALDRAGKLS